MADEQKLKFSFSSEGRFFYKAQVFNFKIEGLPPKANVGLTRDILIPVYGLIKKHFPFLNLDQEGANVIHNFKGYRGSSDRDDILTIEGAIQESADPAKEEISSQKFKKTLASTFNKYQDGDILYNVGWKENQTEDALEDFSIEEILVGVCVYITSFRFALEGYAKTGFSYRVFNVPSQVFDFEISMEESFQINFKLKKGTPLNFLNFLSELFALVIEIFGLEEDIGTQLLGVDEKIQTRLGGGSVS